MIPIGYMAKRICARPEWIGTESVADIYSLSGCISENFADYIRYWRHNGYWLFDSPRIIVELAQQQSIDLTGTRLFFYEAHELEFDDSESTWTPFQPEASFETRVIPPSRKSLEGWDVVTFSVGTSPECSPLSCCSLACEIETNAHCLLPSFERAEELLAEGRFGNTEPGPFRIIAVHSTDWP